jgi:predicted permease
MPRRLPRIRHAWRTLTGQAGLDRDLDAELGSALDELTERHRAAGDDPVTARRRAAIEMGGIETVKDDVRDVRAGAVWLDLLRDIAFAWRGLWKTPGFAVAAIATLAIGIGANAATFSLVNAVLLQPLPFRQPDRLVFVWADMTAAGYPRGPMSGPELADLRTHTTRFEGFGAIWATTTALTGDDHPQQLRIGLVTGNFFSLLGAEAAIGRTFVAEDESDAAPTAILLSDGLWRSRYGGDPSIVGRRVLVNDQPATVVGVMPAGFRLLMPPDSSVPDHLEAWVPFNRQMPQGPRGQMFLRVVGRMRPGVTLEQAARDVSDVADRIGTQFSEYGSAGRAFSTIALHDDGVRDIRRPLLVLQSGVVVLLLIACVNVAGLLVARAAGRSRETAVRLALGAGTRRLFSQCVAEGLVLAGLGAAAGLGTAYLSMALLLAARPPSLDRIASAVPDGRVLAFTAVTALGVAIAFSLAPLVEMVRTNLVGALQRGGRSLGSALHDRLRRGLVVVQIALGVVLLVGAGLLVRTFSNLLAVQPGFDDSGILTFRLSLPFSRYRTQDAVDAFNRALESRLAAVPGASGAGAISHLPFDYIPNWSTTYLTEAGGDESLARRADSRAVSPGAFRTIGARIIEGRDFSEDDDQHSQLVAIVDETLARRAWPDGNAVGQRLATDPRVTGRPTVWVIVVGVVRHIRHLSLLEDVREQVYFPVRQAPRNPMIWLIKTSGDPASLAERIRPTIASLDAPLPFYDVRPLTAYVDDARATQRFTMFLAAVFAVVALTLASVGVYGVVQYGVLKRRQEFALRVALGASRSAVFGLVMRDGVRLALVGLSIGVAGALVVTPLLSTQLFGVTPLDPVSYALVVPALALVALAACLVPAWRALAVSPVEGLRQD